jgi:hypothetical protein
MKAAGTSETLVNLYKTAQRYKPADSRLHTRRRENLKFLIRTDCILTFRMLIISQENVRKIHTTRNTNNDDGAGKSQMALSASLRVLSEFQTLIGRLPAARRTTSRRSSSLYSDSCVDVEPTGVSTIDFCSPTSCRVGYQGSVAFSRKLIFLRQQSKAQTLCANLLSLL